MKIKQSTKERGGATGYPTYAQLQKMYDYSLEIICSIDAEGRFQEVSQACYRILGYTPSELIGKFYIDFVIEADRRATQHATALVESGVKMTNFGNRYYHKDGRIIPIIWSSHWDEEEKTMFCIARDASDIFEKKNLEDRFDAERTQQHEQMNEMLARIADGFFSIDTDWQIVYANPQVENIFGAKREAFLFKNFWECFPYLEHSHLQSMYEEAMDRKHPVHFDAYFKPFQKWFAINVYPSPTGLSVFFLDITREQKVRAELFLSNERFQYATMDDAIYDWDIATNTLTWGKGLFTIFGYQSEELQMDDWESFLVPVERKRMKKNLEQTLKKGSTNIWEAEYSFMKKDGSVCNVLEKGHIIRDDGGKAIRMVGKMQDVTERKKAESERQHYENKISEQNEVIIEVLEQMGSGFLTIDWDGIVLSWNREAELLTSVPRTAVLGKSLWELYPGIKETDYYKVFEQLAKDGKPIQREVFSPFMHRWMDISAYTTGKGVSVFFSDISQRKKAEEEIRKLSLIAHQTDNLVILADRQGKITWVNDAFTEISKYSIEEAIGHKPGDLLRGPGTDPAVVIYMHDQLAKEEGFTTEVLNYSKDGKPFWLHITCQPLLNSNGEVESFFAIETDITNRKSLEGELEEQQKRTNAAVIDAQERERAHVGQELHDNVNQVLTTVKLYQELCLASIPTRDDLTRRSIDLLQGSISEIRSLSKRLSAPSLGNIKLNESVRDLVEAIEATGKVILYLDDTAIENLEVDQAVHLSLYRILQEQLTNVLKHAGAVTVDISFEMTGQYLVMKIVDDGKGFDLSNKGSGIGISNIKTRVESLEGKAFIQSAPGKGTSLTVQLPCHVLTCCHPEIL